MDVGYYGTQYFSNNKIENKFEKAPALSREALPCRLGDFNSVYRRTMNNDRFLWCNFTNNRS